MTTEPPAEYVAFVARHLEPLRRDAERVVGAGTDPDALYVDVLTEVATHWSWLELQRTRLGHRHAADDYLRRVFARRSEGFTPDFDESDAIDIEVTAWEPADPDGRPKRLIYVSNAVRLAPLVVPRRQIIVGAACEASIAWWHAYEAVRRRRYTAAVITFVMMLAVLTKLSPPAQ